LIEAEWEDWAAVVEIGARHVAGRIPDGGRFVLGGYSNGGALALNYLADALDRDDLPLPGQVILFSPMLGISPFAIFADAHKLFSWVPYFEKSKWVDIYPEYDPFKYNSFPMEAGHQSYELIRTLGRKLASLSEAGRMGELPPILAFQSLVDATVSTEAIVHRLFDQLERKDDELVLFDVNHMSVLKDFIEPRYDRTALLAALEKRETLPYTLTVITNEEDDSPQVAARTRLAGEAGKTSQDLHLRWPPQVYSLAHVAIPFPPTDPVYGIVADARDTAHITIGMLHPRGERGVLNVPPSLMLRLRYNPFFSYIEKRLVDRVADGGR
jgi:alpha-beta hydrolase superfamily lysophospholipase